MIVAEKSLIVIWCSCFCIPRMQQQCLQLSHVIMKSKSVSSLCQKILRNYMVSLLGLIHKMYRFYTDCMQEILRLGMTLWLAGFRHFTLLCCWNHIHVTGISELVLQKLSCRYHTEGNLLKLCNRSRLQ